MNFDDYVKEMIQMAESTYVNSYVPLDNEEYQNPKYSTKLFNNIVNKRRVSAVDDFTNAKHITSITNNGYNLLLYRVNVSDNKFYDWWLDSDQRVVVALFRFKLENDELNEIFVWGVAGPKGDTSFKFRGLCRWLIRAYYLKEYSAIISDTSHTPEGIAYWRSLLKECRYTNKTVAIVDGVEEDIDYLDLSQYWGDFNSTTKLKIYRAKS